MKNLFIVFFALIALSACTKKNETANVLSAQGYKNIEITGYRFFGCDEKDFFHTGFMATSPSGQKVEGVVCAGFLKGSTVRFD